jgi:thiamine-monophosphate kinase
MMDAVRENRRLSRWAALLPRAPAQIGAVHESDCELVALGDGRLLAITVDAIDEEVRLGLYRDAATVGRIAVVATLSDLAAVGADPIGLTLSVSLPPVGVDDVQTRVAMGAAAACRAAGTFVLGGDTNESDTLHVSCAGVGTVPAGAALRRVGMRPGDIVFASGKLGAGAALAATRWLGPSAPALSEGAFHPPPRLLHGRALRGLANACMDTSDGLIATLDQLARLNRLGVRVEPPLARLLAPEADEARRALGLGAFPFLAAHHGEFELVFAVPEARLPELHARATALDWVPVCIGRVEASEGLWIGGRPIDGAFVRNLLSAVGGDVTRYVRGLASACAE